MVEGKAISVLGVPPGAARSVDGDREVMLP
jgi:hypothetical protein